MPAMLDDPSALTIFRTSGIEPYPNPNEAQPTLPADVFPRQVTLRDRVTTATVIPFSSRHQVPASLLAYLSDQLNKEIATGDTYPMIEGMSVEKFSSYWFQNFGAVMLLGNIESADDVVEGKNWAKECLGSYYIKPNYPGRSSHVCNAGFLVTDAARNRGVGRLMGESYLDWAPRLGYTYSVFNLVYETNVASCRIWDALAFKRIGRVKGAGSLKSYPGRYIDAIIYGRDLGPEGEDFVSEERFDKIKFYLKFGRYPAGADRAEKSRLRSAATHYKLDDNDKLMLKGKEVISDPQKQYEIARKVHILQHGGINKTTATIAEKYHWVRIKETVSLVIRNCAECKELGKNPIVRADGVIRPAPKTLTSATPTNGSATSNPSSSTILSGNSAAMSTAGRVLNLSHPDSVVPSHSHHDTFQGQAGQGSVSPQVLNRSLPHTTPSHSHVPNSSHLQRSIQGNQLRPSAPIARMQDDYMPLDPQIMEDVRNDLGRGYTHSHLHTHDSNNHTHDFQTDEQEQHDSNSFHSLLSSSRHHHHHHGHGEGHHHEGVGDEDLDMLIDQGEDGEGGLVGEDVGVIQLQAEVAARAAEEALRTVGREYGSG